MMILIIVVMVIMGLGMTSPKKVCVVGAVLPVIVIIMLVMMIVKFVLAINIISQRKLEVGLSAIAAADDTDQSDDDVVGDSSHH